MSAGFRRIAVVIAMILTLGCGKESAPSDGSAKGDKAASGKGPSTRENAEPAFKLTADAWHQEWDKDAAAAKAKYGKKVIQLTGTVEVVTPDGHGKYGLVRLKTADDNMVLCNTTDREPWWRVTAGSNVTIKGTASPDSKEGELLDCTIVEADKNPATNVTAVQLSRDYAADKSQAKKAYDEKWVILEGELLDTKPANNQLVIKGEGPIRIVCGFSANAIDKERMDAVKAGQTVKLVGKASVDGVGNEIALKYCMMNAKAKK